jgi:hypothetical protein
MTSLELRNLIVSTASSAIGSHYLNGSDGAIPGTSNGMGRELLLKEDSTWSGIAVHAAKNNYGVCRGRFEKVGGKAFKKTDPDFKALEKYAEDLSSSILPSLFWGDFNNTGLYPRRDVNDGIYLGEDCRWTRHFDCESFVAWVIVTALKKDQGTWRKSIEWYNGGGGDRLEVFSKEKGTFPDQSQFLDGDILIKLKPGERHIGFTSAKGKQVIHASGRSIGVVSSTYMDTWTALARIKDSKL